MISAFHKPTPHFAPQDYAGCIAAPVYIQLISRMWRRRGLEPEAGARGPD